MQMTLQELNPTSFRKLTATASDFHVRLSALLETGEVLKIQEGLCFLKSCGWLKNESLVYFSQKTLRDYSIMTGEERSELSYEYFERAKAVNSDNQLYKQAGNSVTVNVIYEIARRLT